MERLEGRAVPASYTAANVPDLIAAINAANATAAADTITLAAGKIFTLTAANNTTDGPTGLPVIVATGGNLTIVGNGGVIERSTVAGTPAFRLLDVAPGASLTLQNMTAQGGLALGDYFGGTPTWAQGGAVFSRGTVTLDGVTVQNNTAHGADGIVGWGDYTYPAGPASGGGVYSEGALTLVGSTLRGNSAIGGKGTSPDYDHPFGDPAGAGGLGGGLYVAGGTASISNSTLAANTAQGGGGGYGRVGGDGVTPITEGGTPGAGGDAGHGFGGGLYAAGGAVTLSSTSVARNVARGGAGGSGGTHGGAGGNGFGGGLYAAGAVAFQLHNTSVTENVAQGGAGGLGGTHKLDGRAGQGIGGGLYIDAVASVGLDSFTGANVRRNKASTTDRDIHGPYVPIS